VRRRQGKGGVDIPKSMAVFETKSKCKEIVELEIETLLVVYNFSS